MINKEPCPCPECGNAECGWKLSNSSQSEVERSASNDRIELVDYKRRSESAEAELATYRETLDRESGERLATEDALKAETTVLREQLSESNKLERQVAAEYELLAIVEAEVKTLRERLAEVERERDGWKSAAHDSPGWKEIKAVEGAKEEFSRKHKFLCDENLMLNSMRVAAESALSADRAENAALKAQFDEAMKALRQFRDIAAGVKSCRHGRSCCRGNDSTVMAITAAVAVFDGFLARLTEPAPEKKP